MANGLKKQKQKWKAGNRGLRYIFSSCGMYLCYCYEQKENRSNIPVLFLFRLVIYILF